MMYLPMSNLEKKCECILSTYKTRKKHKLTQIQQAILAAIVLARLEGERHHLSSLSHEVGEALNFTSPNVQKLIQKKLLRREQADHDRRVTWITPTAKGLNIFK